MQPLAPSRRGCPFLVLIDVIPIDGHVLLPDETSDSLVTGTIIGVYRYLDLGLAKGMP
jgi:hypothetical protein